MDIHKALQKGELLVNHLKHCREARFKNEYDEEIRLSGGGPPAGRRRERFAESERTRMGNGRIGSSSR